MNAAEPLGLLILGAHPDDAEYHAGGLASIYRRRGHRVKMVSVSDGAAGHHVRPAEQLARIRRAEAAAAAAVIGAEAEVWDYPDAQLLPTLEMRREIIRAIRRFAPDLILTHRTNDYHPDHRAVGQCVQDALFLVTVPKVVPEVPALRSVPVVAYLPDLFTKPAPLVADVVLDVTDELETIVEMLACHESQVFEWLPYLNGTLDEVPADPHQRQAWLRAWYTGQIRSRAQRYRKELIATYGRERGAEIQCAEVFEISEYGGPLDEPARRRLFPFAGSAG